MNISKIILIDNGTCSRPIEVVRVGDNDNTNHDRILPYYHGLKIPQRLSTWIPQISSFSAFPIGHWRDTVSLKLMLTSFEENFNNEAE